MFDYGYNPASHVRSIVHSIGLTVDDLRNYDGILDVGAGNCALGFVANNIGVDVTSFDNESYIGLDNSCMPLYKNMVHYKKGDVLDLPFENDSFDLVVGIQAPPVLGLQSSKHVKKALEEMLRVAREEVRFTPPALISMYIVPYRMTLESKRNLYTNDYIESISHKSFKLLTKWFPRIEIISDNEFDYAVLRK